MLIDELKKIIKAHQLWLNNEENGCRANLRDADLRRADLDFSVLSFSCCSLACKTDEKQRIQLMFHALAWMANAESITDEEKSIYNFALDYANKFHRTDVERLIKKED